MDVQLLRELAERRAVVLSQRMVFEVSRTIPIVPLAGLAGTQVVDDEPVDYWSGFPIKSMAHAIKEAGYPAEISNTAGTFVCNHVFYTLMHSLAGKKGIRAGFVHVPYLPVQAALSAQPAPAWRSQTWSTPSSSPWLRPFISSASNASA